MSPARVFAGLVALAAWTGLGLQLHASATLSGSVPGAVWAMLLYFTIITNLVVAGVFSLIALGRAPAPRLIAGAMMAILLVGVTFALLLRGLNTPTGAARAADFIMHEVTPVAVPLWWLAFAAKGRLVAGDPFRWMAPPLAYFPYGIARGMAGGKYPYPFMNPAEIGWAGVAAHAAALAAGFLIAGHVVLWLDRRLARDAPRG